MPTNLDLTAPIEGKIFVALQADAQLAALTPAVEVHPQAVPADAVTPFIKMGATIATPLFLDGRNGTSMSSAVHVFTRKKRGSVADPKGLAAEVNAHIVRILDAMDGIAIGDGLTLDIFPRQSQVMQDGDPDAFHGFVLYEAVAS